MGLEEVGQRGEGGLIHSLGGFLNLEPLKKSVVVILRGCSSGA